MSDGYGIESSGAISVDDLGDDPRLDVEAQLLCALVWAPPADAKWVIATVTAIDFDRPVYVTLFDQIAQLVESGQPHDPAHVSQALSREGLTAGHKGNVLAAALADITTLGSGGEIRHHVNAVLTQAYRRAFHQLGTSMIDAATELAERDLFPNLVAHGVRLRSATQRLEEFRGMPL